MENECVRRREDLSVPLRYVEEKAAERSESWWQWFRCYQATTAGHPTSGTCSHGNARGTPQDHHHRGNTYRMTTVAPNPFGGACSSWSPGRIARRITWQQIGIAWFVPG